MDNCSNKALRDGTFDRIGCFGHAVRNAVNKALNLEKIKGVIDKLTSIQNIFAHSWQLSRGLKSYQRKFNMTEKSMPSYCKTR